MLERSGLEVWCGNDVRDLLVLASQLDFGAVLVDEISTLSYPELWDQADEALPDLPVLVHSASMKEGWHESRSTQRVGIAGGSPEVVLAMVTLLLQEAPQESRAAA